MVSPGRRFLPLLAGLPLVAALAGCPEAGQERTLTLWHAWGGAELSALKSLIAKFEAAHPDVDVLALQVPYDKLKDKYTRSAAANGGPDLVIGDADWSGKFSTSDLVIRADDLFTGEELARFHPQALDSLRLDGKLYAVPESRETVALYYNKKLMPTPPKTVGDWFARSKDIDAASGGKAKGLVFNGAFYFAMGYYFAEGGTLFDGAGKPSVESPGGLRALALVERMTTAPGMMATHEYAKPDAQYKEGRAASIVNGPWALVDYQKALGPDFGIATLPTLDNGRPAASWVGVKCLMFNSNADQPHRKMAKDFALFMTTPESQLQLSQEAGHIPAVKGVKLPPDSPLATFQAQADVGTPVSIRPEVSLVWDPMNEAFRNVLEHNATKEAALGQAQKLIEANLEAQKAHGQ
jgi:arabinogalactan oligomer/maltooligosaccharide transport system substrate-binding protein